VQAEQGEGGRGGLVAHDVGLHRRDALHEGQVAQLGRQSGGTHVVLGEPADPVCGVWWWKEGREHYTRKRIGAGPRLSAN
jgi:hypothetical protein